MFLGSAGPPDSAAPGRAGGVGSQCCAAVIADIVGSRRLADRSAAQRALVKVLDRAAAGLDLLQPPEATVGDEFQAISPTLDEALTLTLRIQLLAPDGLSLRFGVGLGEIRPVEAGGARRIQDGPAWWSARAAIEDAHRAEDRVSFIRTRVELPADESAARAGGQHLLNAMLALRDQAVSRMQERPRQVLADLIGGATQVEAARAHGVTQAAVSSVARGTGAGVLEAQRLLTSITQPALEVPWR